MAAMSEARQAQARLPELETELQRVKSENAALKQERDKAVNDRDAAIAALRSPVGSDARAAVEPEESARVDSDSQDETVALTGDNEGGKKPVRRAKP